MLPAIVMSLSVCLENVFRLKTRWTPIPSTSVLRALTPLITTSPETSKSPLSLVSLPLSGSVDLVAPLTEEDLVLALVLVGGGDRLAQSAVLGPALAGRPVVEAGRLEGIRGGRGGDDARRQGRKEHPHQASHEATLDLA